MYDGSFISLETLAHNQTYTKIPKWTILIRFLLFCFGADTLISFYVAFVIPSKKPKEKKTTKNKICPNLHTFMIYYLYLLFYFSLCEYMIKHLRPFSLFEFLYLFTVTFLFYLSNECMVFGNNFELFILWLADFGFINNTIIVIL